GIIEQRIGEVAGAQRIDGIVGIAAGALHLDPDRAIEQPRVEMRQTIMARERPADRALARSRRSVDRDDHAMSAPSPVISAAKPGKLVATGLISSIVTPPFPPSPATAKLIAMR